MKRYRINSKFRFTTFLTILILLSVLATGSFFGFFDASSMDNNTNKSINVESGDTLWELAKDYGPTDKDCRQIVYEICKFNNITAATLIEGSIILIPNY